MFSTPIVSSINTNSAIKFIDNNEQLDILKFRKLINKKTDVKKTWVNKFMVWIDEFTQDKKQEISQTLNNL